MAKEEYEKALEELRQEIYAGAPDDARIDQLETTLARFAVPQFCRDKAEEAEDGIARGHSPWAYLSGDEIAEIRRRIGKEVRASSHEEPRA